MGSSASALRHNVSIVAAVFCLLKKPVGDLVYLVFNRRY
ncbi:hypothetical protein A2U01_0044476, partial [Trifolium medium]|nr:hypothetical protein [Trifolium medium]